MLFAVLAILLGVGFPVIKSEAPLKASDWLGFAGNIIAAVFAAVAAVVAWVAAQRQIKQATRQNSVIAYGTLRDVLASINSDVILNQKIHHALEMIASDARTMRQEGIIGAAEAEMNISIIQRSLGELRTAEDALMDGRANPWGGSQHRNARENLIHLIGVYAIMCGGVLHTLTMANAKTVPAEQIVDAVVSSLREAAVEASEVFGELAVEEMDKIHELMDKHFESVTVHS